MIDIILYTNLKNKQKDLLKKTCDDFDFHFINKLLESENYKMKNKILYIIDNFVFNKTDFELYIKTISKNLINTKYIVIIWFFGISFYYEKSDLISNYIKKIHKI